MQLNNSSVAATSDNEKNISLAAVLKHIVVILISIYLVCIPLGKVGQKRFTPVDMGILVILLIVNSDIKFKEVVERISSAKLTPTSVEVTLKEKVEQLSEKIDDQAKKIDELDKADAEAKSCVDLQLSETSYKNVNLDDLSKKIGNASSSAKEAIYKMAKDARRNGHNKNGIIERTIPIFQALIDSKYKNARCRFYAQLGYALKDQENPDWEEAKNNLDVAISLWEQNHPNDTLPSVYCFNWLFCAANSKDKLELEQEEINKRIEAATICETLYAAIKDEKHKNILDWMCKNYRGDISKLTPKLNNLSGYCRKDSDERKKLLSGIK